MRFAHLHTHSHYSLLEASGKPDEILDCVKELGMDTLAVTEYANLYSAVEFTTLAKERDMKVIIGCEMFVSARSIEDTSNAPENKITYNLTLLAENEVGYKNLMRLVTKAHLDGNLFGKPRVDKKLLKTYHEGLIALSGCLDGEIPQWLIKDDAAKARKAAEEYKDIFGTENFYFEMQHHPRIGEQERVNRGLKALGKELGIPLVATADIHSIRPEDAHLQDIMLCIKDNRKEYENDRRTMVDYDLYIKSPEEMAEAFKDTPEAIENTAEIADRCTFKIKLGDIQLPRYPLPKGETPSSALRKMTEEKLRQRYGNAVTEEQRDRMEYELDIIDKMGYPDYFLIVQDFVNWARSNGIVVGPGRGSAAGSFVSYLVGITNIDPIQYDLLFERFLNPERVSMPDVDMDFADNRRDDVLEYCREKYGWDHVAHIITFGTMAARAAIRDTGRALGLAYGFCDQVAKLIPMFSSIEKALEEVPEFRDLYQKNQDAKRLIDTAKGLEGCCRHASIHACGVVITKDPVVEYTPLQRVSGDEKSVCTQYSSSTKTSYVEKIGLLKMDFLGLKNLTIIQDTLHIIKKIHRADIDIETLPQNDEKTYTLLQRGETTGVFQLESSGMKRYLKLLRPTVFEDIIAMVALYRPGPMEWIPDFIGGKHGTKKVKYLHPKLESILGNTYGVAVYQEQVMQIAQALAGFSLGEADILRKAMGKKILDLIKKQREKFIEGCEKTGVGKRIGEKVFTFIEPFAGYGFNRCVTGDTIITDALTGKRHLLKEIAESFDRNASLPTVHSLQEDKTLKAGKITKVYKNGRKKVYTVTTRSGRTIRATTNHPFYTIRGWEQLKHLQPGSKIATARIMNIQKQETVPSYKIALLGYLLAEGNLCHPHGFYFYSKSKDEINDYESNLCRFANTKATRNTSKSAISVYAGRKNLKKESEAVKWIRSIGLYGKTATQKYFPEFVFQLGSKQLSLLIGKMFQGDGCINSKRQNPQIFYATSSKCLAQELQHLLLRLNIMSTIHTKHFKYRNTLKTGYTVTINRYTNISSFVQGPGKYLVGEKRNNLVAAIQKHKILNGTAAQGSARGSKDSIPIEILSLIKRKIIRAGHALRPFAKKYGFAERLLFADTNKKGFLRETILKIGTILRDTELIQIASSDIYWDEIISIGVSGIEETYDLTIENTHNFVANDIIVHNSHAACYALIGYQTAYLKAHYPAEFMAALLTSDQGNSDRVAIEVSEARDMGITVLPPNVNESFESFSARTPKNTKQKEKNLVNNRKATILSAVQGADEERSQAVHAGTAASTADRNEEMRQNRGFSIRFGLNAIKNVGHPVARAIVEERKKNGNYTSLANFIERVQIKDMNKRSLESLAKVGAFDDFAERSEVLQNIDTILAFIKSLNAQKNSAQSTLFDNAAIAAPTMHLKDALPATKKQSLGWEKELLGLYVSDHPTREYETYLDRATDRLDRLTPEMIGKIITIGGIIQHGKKIYLKDQKQMYFAMVENTRGKIECVVFPRTYEQTREMWQDDAFIIVSGKLSDKDGEFKLLAETVKALTPEEVENLKRIEATRKKYTPQSPATRPLENSGRVAGETSITLKKQPQEGTVEESFIIIIPEGTSKEKLQRLSDYLKSLPSGKVQIFLDLQGKKVRTSYCVAIDDAIQKEIDAILKV